MRRFNVSLFSWIKATGLESECPDTPSAKLKNRWSYSYLPPYSFMSSFYVLLDAPISLAYGTVGNSVFFFSAEIWKNSGMTQGKHMDGIGRGLFYVITI